MNKKYKVIVSDRARQMMGEHIRFMSLKNPTAAMKVKNRITESIRSLESMPKRFPFFQEASIPPNKYHKMFVEKWYLVLYQIKEDIVYVDYIVDCRQDYEWLLH